MMHYFLNKKNELAHFAKNCSSTLLTFEEFIFSVEDSSLRQLIAEATLFAAKAHFGQTRNQNNQIPYIVHPLRVSYLLWNEGNINNAHLLVAALLHDVLEDTEVSRQEIFNKFGSSILTLVEELTDKPKPTAQEEALSALKMSKEAKTIKLADRTHNLRDLIDHPPKIWDFEKVSGFLNRSKILFENLRNTHPVLEKCY
jgi:(p)ppGpp synthase/HD superfamily hydrolase